jgi:GrpB-like predicted nucleotidyltransferase (UPF0157 family)
MRIHVVASNPDWPAKWEHEAHQITRALGEIVVGIHHIGSTAIPGMYAKPIIDILLEVVDIVRLDSLVTGMASLGYECLGEYGIRGRRYFRKDNSSGTRTHQVHAFQHGDRHIHRHLAFRDYLIAHADVANAYSDLKRELAAKHPEDAEAYMDGKEPFINAHQAKALAWVSGF